MNRSSIVMALITACAFSGSLSQAGQSKGSGPEASSTLRISSRAVLVDVMVTDRSGHPVTGLKQEDFSVNEQGKPQKIAYFEEHQNFPAAAMAEMPELPPNVFCNFSPAPKSPVVNVLLLDSLNTPLEDQSYVHQKALIFLRSLKPGSRMAIFSMSLGLRFVQGFTDDPALLVASLRVRGSNEVEVPELMKSDDEANAQTNLIGEMQRPEAAGGGTTETAAPQAMIDALISFFQQTNVNEETDRAYRTLANLQQLAAFLGGFPGRKNLIWFSESFPLRLFGDSTMRLDDEIKKTVNLLTAARVAVYPVDARGVRANAFYEAGDTATPSPSTSQPLTGVAGIQAGALIADSNARNSDQETMSMLAQDSGGKAFANTNGLSEVIADIVASSKDFYTVSYSPSNQKMDDSVRHIEVKVAGGKYNLAYRRSYYASDAGLPGAVKSTQDAGTAMVTDPLRPFMDFGMPQTEQILYKALVKRIPAGQPSSETERVGRNDSRYSVDFALDLNDLSFQVDDSGVRKGMLNLSLIVYDRLSNIVRRKDQVVALTLKPDVYAFFREAGVQLHAEIEVPQGQYWLKTGVYDQATHKAGTMEIPLSVLKPVEVASK